MKRLLNTTILVLIFLFSSCSYFELDNYDAPDSGIEGVVVDRKTGKPLSTEAGNSYKVDYYELSWEEAGHENTQSRYFWGKSDGSFKNSKIFAGKYRITLKEGAFHDVEPEVVTLSSGKLTELNFSVIPFGRVTLDEITLSGTNQNNLTIKYTVEDTETEINTEGISEDLYKLDEAQIFLSSQSPNVGFNCTETKYTVRAKKDISQYTPGIPETYTETNVRGLSPGTYWIRVGIRSSNPQKRYNYTPIQEIIIPEIDE